jgi:hypothetical protein
MATMVEMFEYFARDCRSLAEQIDEPKHREILLKFAMQWETAAQQSREASTQSTPLRTAHRARS